MKLPRFKILTSMALITAMLAGSVPVATPFFAAEAPEPPAAWGATPNAGQLAYHKEELAAFIHFGMNTFTGVEWGTGTEQPAQFTLDPENLDTDQWVRTLKDAGFKRLIFVAKHHDGFLNWYSELSDHGVESATEPVDVFAALSKSCTDYDMDMGVYLSPWDANAESYGAVNPSTGEIDPWAYNEYYTGLLEEILDPANKKYGNDGKFVEVWMDGARGAGYYQPYFFDKDFLKQAKNLRTTNPELLTSNYKTYPDYIDTLELTDDDTWFGVIKKHNPDMVVFSPVGSELRWPATESGRLAMPVWSKVDAFKQRALYIANGESESGTATTQLANGDPNGQDWSIPEADTSVTTSGWFENNNPNEAGNKNVKTMQQLGDTYFESVGRGGVLLLNFPPNVNGKLSQKQVDRVTEFGNAIKDTFAENLAEGATATASSFRGSHETYAAANVLDGDYDTYWTMDDGRTAGSVTLDLGGDKTFDLVSIQEYIPLGQRVAQYKVETYSNGTWKQYGKGSLQTTIGHKALVRGGIVTASQVRVTILDAQAVPLINEIGLYKMAHPAFEVAATTEFEPNASMKMLDERNPAMKYTGTWHNETMAGTFENTHKYSDRVVGSMITATFTGDSFSVVGMSDPNHSKMDVFIDGVKSGVADFSGARATRHLAYQSPVLENRRHEIKLITTETNKAGSIDAIFYTDVKDKPFYHIEKNSYTESKFSGSASFNVYRTGKIDEDSSVQISTAQDSAIAGRHFVHVDETLTFAPGETRKTVSVQLLSNEDFSSLDFYLRLDPVGDDVPYLYESYSVAKVTITDDPAEPLSLKATFADPGRRYGVIGVNQTVPGDLAAVRAMNETSFEATAWKGDMVSAQLLLSTDGLDGVQNIEMIAGELSSGGDKITGVKTSPLLSVRASTGRATPNSNVEMVPDIMAPPTSDIGDLPAQSVLPVWVSVDIPRDAAPGTYTGTITVTADGLAAPQSFDLSIEVLDLVQPEPSQNEFYLDLWQYPYTSARYYGVEPWSDAHFDYLKEQAAAYRDAGGTTVTATIAHNPWGQAPAGQNQQTYDEYPSMVKWTRTSGTGTTAQFEFDYTEFDQWIEFNLDNGIDQQIDCYGILPWGSRNQFYDADGKLVSETFGSGDPRWAHYWSQMLDSFVNHLYEKGWLDITFIATDERAITDMERVAELVKSKKAPDGSVLKISSALNYGLTNDTSGVLDKIDHVSLNIDEVEDSFAAFTAARRAKGLNTTVYTCTGNYPNSFTRSQPAESAWMMYYSQKFGANGFLRWAFDAWTMEPLWSTDHWYWESGDCFQFYPAPYGETEPQSSPGYEMLKQGIRDVEKANYLKRIEPSLAAEIDALFAAIEKPVANTHYVSRGNLKDGTAAGNDKMVADMNVIRDGLSAIAKEYIAADPEPKTFTVTFDKNDGSGVYETMTVTSPAISLGDLPIPPTSEETVFTGWNTKADASGFAFLASSTVTGDLTVYAKWGRAPEPSVTLNKTELSLTVGSAERLTASVVPYGSAVTWTTSDPAVATVDNNGLVTAAAKGAAVITAAIEGGYTATCAVTVLPAGDEKVNFSRLPEASATSSGVEAGSVAAANAIDGVKDYVANITRWGSSTGTDTVKWLQVDLGEKKRFDEIVLDWERKNANSYTISISDNGTDFTTVKTFSDYPAEFIDVITFDTPVAARYVRLTIDKFRATDVNRFGQSVTWSTVSLFEFEIWGYPIEKAVTLDKETLTMNAKETARLTATIEPEWITATWTSSDESVATVDQTGLVTAVSAGTAVITATIEGGISDSVAVSIAAQNLALDKPVTVSSIHGSAGYRPSNGYLNQLTNGTLPPTNNGDTNNRWVPNDTRANAGPEILTPYMTVDFGEETTLNKLVVYEWRGGTATPPGVPASTGYRAQQITVLISDDNENWTEAGSWRDVRNGVIGETAADNSREFFLDTPVTTKYLRFRIDDYAQKGTASEWMDQPCLVKFYAYNVPAPELRVIAGEGGYVNRSGGDYAASEAINLVATPKAGYVFDKWEATGGGFSNVSINAQGGHTAVFTMPEELPDEPITVTAIFKPLNTPVFTDKDGNTLTALSANSLVTTMLRQNESDAAENLTMIVAVYSPDGKLVYVGQDEKEISAGESQSFNITLDLSENADGGFAAEGYYAHVFLWDSDTLQPITEKVTLK